MLERFKMLSCDLQETSLIQMTCQLRHSHKSTNLLAEGEVVRMCHHQATAFNLSALPPEDPDHCRLIPERPRPSSHKHGQPDIHFPWPFLSSQPNVPDRAKPTVLSGLAPYQIVGLHPPLPRHPTLVVPHHHRLLEANRGRVVLHPVEDLNVGWAVEGRLHQVPQPPAHLGPELTPVVEHPPVGSGVAEVHLVPSHKRQDRWQTVPDVVVVVVVVRHEGEPRHVGGIVRQSVGPSQRVRVPWTVVVVSTLEAQDPPDGRIRWELLILHLSHLEAEKQINVKIDSVWIHVHRKHRIGLYIYDYLAFLVRVVHCAHEPRVAV